MSNDRLEALTAEIEELILPLKAAAEVAGVSAMYMRQLVARSGARGEARVHGSLFVRKDFAESIAVARQAKQHVQEAANAETVPA